MLRARYAAVFLSLLALGAPLRAQAAKVCAYTIPVTMMDKVDSKSARSGGVFRFRVTQPVSLAGGTEIPVGTIGYGIIREADPAGRRAHDGSLSLEPRYLLVRKPRPQAGSRVKSAGVAVVSVTMNPTLPVVWTPNEPLLQKGLSRVPLPVPGIAMTAINTLRWGRNITLGPGFNFSVIPAGDLGQGPIC